jgi:hypothetical protein
MGFETTVSVGIKVNGGAQITGQNSPLPGVKLATSQIAELSAPKTPCPESWVCSGEIELLPEPWKEKKELAYVALATAKYKHKDPCSGQEVPAVRFQLIGTPVQATAAGQQQQQQQQQQPKPADNPKEWICLDAPRIYVGQPGHELGPTFSKLKVAVHSSLFDRTKTDPPNINVTVSYGVKDKVELKDSEKDCQGACAK